MAKTCAEEGCSEPSQGKADRCAVHRRDRVNRLRKRPPRTCVQCGNTFEPFHGATRCEDCRAPKQRERDVQMEKLFRYYKEKANVVVDEADDGARVLIVSDHQFPFADEPFLEAEEAFIADWRPNYIIYAGDVIDAYELSDFDKRPERLFNFEAELTMAREMMERHKRLSPTAKLYFCEGNHEERLQRTIWRHAQGFSFAVKDIPELLELERLTEGFVPYGKHIDFLGYIITHGSVARRHSAYTAKAMLDSYRSSGASGHTHRLGMHAHSDSRGISHSWIELGCHCRKDLEYMKSPPDWQSGFVIAHVYDNTLFPQVVPVIEAKGQRSFVAAGKHYRIHG